MDIPNPICYCLWNAVENTENYLLHCSNFANQRTLLFDDLRNIGINYGPLYSSTYPRCFYFVTLSFLITLIAVQFMQLLNLLNQSIVLSDLFMINITPNIFHFDFIFSVYFIFQVNLDYFFSGAVFLAIWHLVPCENTAFSLQWLLFSFWHFYLCWYQEKNAWNSFTIVFL